MQTPLPKEQELELYITEGATKKVEEEFIKHPNQLLSREVLLERYKQELRENFSNHEAQVTNGAAAICESLEELAKIKPELITEQVLEKIENITTLSELIENNEQAFLEHISEGKTLQSFAKIDDDTLDVLYQAAKKLFDEKNLDKARCAFYLLTNLNSTNYAFWLGYANAAYEQERYKEALEGFLALAEASPDDPQCQLALSRCYGALDDIENAIVHLKAALTKIGNNQEYAGLKEELEQENEQLFAKLRH